MYKVDFSDRAKKELKRMSVSDIRMARKVRMLIKELAVDPRVGTGHPERLKYKEEEIWSRRINKKDRLVYEIIEDEILVTVLSAMGHYE